jgi:zinc protease
MVRATVYKEILPNGLVVLVVPRHDIPKVCVQLFYNVGSKDEGAGLWNEAQQKWVNEQGIAHFIEHMIFKGTNNLSESDINELTARLSGSCNAFTSYDYTGYLFDMPSQHWYEALPVMADCMKNCTFKQEHINSELKAVIQEIKMYNDDYVSTLIEKMTAAIFNDHPYHHPVIGYKQDLWNLKRENLLEFYQTHYGPNNAVLVVTGDVSPTEVFKHAEENFGMIPPFVGYTKKTFQHTRDIISHNVIIHRDVQQPIILYCWEVPGAREKKDYLLDLMSWIIGAGKGARLYNKLVTEMGIATEMQSFVYDLFDQGLFFMYVQPRSMADVELIRKVILEELQDLSSKEVSDAELRRAQKKTEMDFLNLSEDNQKQGYLLGKAFLVTGDENYILNYCSQPQENLKKEIQQLFKLYFSPSVMHSGQVLPLVEQDKAVWLELQKKSDEEDTRILGSISREAEVEKATYANTIVVERPQQFTYPKAQKFVLANGLTVLHYNKPDLGKIDLVMDLKAKHYYDPENRQGLSVLMADLLQEGTKNYSTQGLALELESYGMELNTFPGQVGMTLLSQDLQKGLEILTDVLVHPLFQPDAIERIRMQLLAELKYFWDSPQEFASQILRKAIYKDHPYSYNAMGDEKALKAITRDEIIDAHKRYITPKGARMALVGDLTGYDDVQKVLEATLGTWTGPEVPDFVFPAIEPIKAEVINYPINRDQVVLCYGGLSVNRFSDDYDSLLIFDQIFTGGVLGSMNSRLFELREHTGLFYTIGGSLLAGVNRQPGMVYVKTIVSNDRLEEAQTAIEKVINEAAATFTDEEMEEAQLAIINSLVDNFSSNRQIAATLIYLEKFELPENYFDIRVEQLLSVPVEQVKETVKKYLDTSKMIKVKVGRL